MILECLKFAPHAEVDCEISFVNGAYAIATVLDMFAQESSLTTVLDSCLRSSRGHAIQLL